MSPIDDGGREAEGVYEQRIERTDTAYEGEHPAFMMKKLKRDLRWAKMRKQRHIRMKENKRRRLLGDVREDPEVLKDTPNPEDPPAPFFDYILYRNGSRGKMAVKNEDVFIIWGQNALMSWVLIIAAFFVLIVGVGYKKEGTIAKLTTKLYMLCITAFFIKFMFVSFTELGLHNVIITQPWYYRVSYITSLVVINIYVFEILMVWQIVKLKITEKEALKMSFRVQLAHEEYTRYMHPDQIKAGNTFLIKDKIRWFIIFLMISSLQLLNRSQAFFIFLVDLVYYSHVMLELKRN